MFLTASSPFPLVFIRTTGTAHLEKTSRSLELLMRCHEFRYASSLCISNLFQHEYRSPNLHLSLLGPLQLLWFMWCKSIWHITTAKNMKQWLSAIVTGITLYHLMVICFYILAWNVQITGFASLMLLSNSLSLSPSTHNWCSIHSRQTSILYFAYNLVPQFHSGRGSFHKHILECGT